LIVAAATALNVVVPAAAEIEDPVALGMVEEFEIDLHDVVDEHEVAPLLAGAVAARALEQAHVPVARVLIAELPARPTPSALCAARAARRR
jgi:hypothetical protein